MFGGTHTFTHIQTEASRGRPPKDLELGEKLHDDLVDPIPIHKTTHTQTHNSTKTARQLYLIWLAKLLFIYVFESCVFMQSKMNLCIFLVVLF